ncbi:hypothetical protein BH11ACT8_BH11ACT8_27480 [soil metagenome]
MRTDDPDHDNALDENGARALLDQAGDTIDVAPAGPLDTSLAARPRWPVLAAAAAVVLIVGGVAVGVGGGDPSRRLPPGPADSTPSAGASDGAFRLGPDQVPSVFGFDEQAARTLLENRGLRVTVWQVATCESPDRALGTEPETGTLITPGAAITLRVSSELLGNCVAPRTDRTRAFELLLAARDRGPLPARTGDVDLTPALAALRTLADAVGRYDLEGHLSFPTPELDARRADQLPCASDVDTSGAGYWLSIEVGLPQGQGPRGFPCHEVYVHYAPQDGFEDAIDRVVVPDQLVAEGEARTPADVIGNSVAVATERLEAQGYAVDAVARSDCQPLDVVSAQEPSLGEAVEAGATVRLAYTDATGGCVRDASTIATPATGAAAAFVEFARGGDTPPFADAVSVYVRDDLRATLTGDDRARRRAWRVDCNDTGYCLPPPSALEVLAAAGSDVVQSDTRSTCPEHPDENNHTTGLLDLDGLTLVRLSEAEPASCHRAWSVELYVDDEGRIAVIDLLLGDRYSR